MKRFFIILMVFTALVVFSACSKSAGTEILLVSNKIEIDGALKAYAAVYQKQTGVKINIRSFGGENSYAPNLTAMFNAGTEPEIFVFEGISGYEDAKRSGRVTDLSNEPWVNDTDVAFIDPENGMIVGFPVAIEGWGLGYNKALLAKAGIDPASMTNIAGIRAAFNRINSMKNELGIENVVSMAAGPGMTWVTGLHALNGYLTLGLPYADSDRYIDMLNAGSVDTTRLVRFAEYMDLLFRNSNRATLLTGGYDQQLGDFALERTVFIHQGNWTDPTFKELGVNFEMGYVPHAFLDENTDGIFVGAPSYYLVNAKSAKAEEAMKFLNALASTAEGHNYMVNEAGMVPAFKSVTLQPPGQFSIAVQEWTSKGKIYSWKQNDMPDGFGMETLGPIFSQLASEQIGVSAFVRMVTSAVASLR